MLIKKKKLTVKLIEPNGYREPVVIERTNGHAISDKIKQKEAELLSQLEADIHDRKARAELEISQMLSEAQSQADEIINSAQVESERVFEQLSREKSVFENEKESFRQQVKLEKDNAYKQGMQEAQVYIDEFNKYLQTFQHAEKNIMLEVLPQITAIALDVSKQILAYEVAHNPNLLEQQVLRSIDKVISSKGIIQIYLNSADFVQADNLERALTKLLDPSTRLVFVKDDNVNKGSCMINTQGGRLNATFSSQLQLIKLAFEKYLGQSIQELPETLVTEDDDTPLSKDKANIHIENEPSNEDLDLIDADPVDMEFDAELDDLLDDLMKGISKEVGPANTQPKKTKSLSKKSKSGFNNKKKDLLMEDQMAKLFDDEFEEVEEETEEDDDSFDDLEDDFEDEEEEFEDLEEFEEEDFTDEEEEEDDEEDPRYPEY